MTFERAATLAMWRAGQQPDDVQCQRLFGVGPEILQRIESGEVEPEPDVAERILRVILSTPPVAHSGGSLGAGGFPNFAGATFSCGAPIQANRGALPGASR